MLNKRNNIIFRLLFAFVIVCIPFTSAYASSKMKLYIYGTKENVTYTGQQVQYKYNGASINMRNTPGIIIDGTSLASYKDIFAYSGMKVKYEYVKSKGTVTLSQNDITIVYTIGSKKALVNGKKVTLSIAPIKVKFKDKDVTKILVPARFTAETLGYKYDWNSTTLTASISKHMSLYYNGTKVSYTGSEGKVTIDGVSVKPGKMPSIIVNSTAMVRAKSVFSSSSIDADYAYNTSQKVLTLTKEDKVVQLTMGSSIAYVNGIARTMDTSPLIVKNLDTNTSYVMVPGSFVASYLGYDYAWNVSSKTSVITIRAVDDSDDEEVIDGPELGGDPHPSENATSINWGVKNELLDEYININNINNTTEISNDYDTTAYVYTIAKDSLQENNKEIYSLYSSTPFSKSTVTLQDDILTLHMNNTSTDYSSYYLGGSLVDVISTTNDPINTTSDVNFNLLDTNVKYELTLSEDRCTLYVTLYKNYLSNITAGTKAGNDYVLLTGMNELTVNAIEDATHITLQIPNTVNAIGENYTEISSLNSLKSVQSTSADNMITIILEKSVTSEYFVTQAGNTYMITLEDNNNVDNSSYDLNIMLPTGVNYADVTQEDRYYNRQFAIIIPGDYRSHYLNNPLISSNAVVRNISVYYNDFNETEIIVTTSKLQGYKLEENLGYIGVTIGNPKDIYQNIVVLDAGHGGTDPGALRKLNGATINEKDINFSILFNRAKKYFDSDDSNIKVYYSRYNDTKVPLDDRAAFAKQVGADLFVSLHMNANNTTTIKGTEIYYSNSNKAVTTSGLTSKTLAAFFLDELPDAVGTKTRNIRAQEYVVIKKNTVPAILVELAFMSNPDDLKLMTKDSFQEKAAESIYDILCSIFEAYPTGR